MAVAQGPVDHLDRLPDEIILGIIEQPCLSVRDMISLACTSRRHYRVTISPAYKAHITRQCGLAVYWAIENDQYNTLKRLVDSGVNVNMLRGSDIINEFAQTFHCADEITMKAFTGVLDHLDSEAMVSPLA